MQRCAHAPWRAPQSIRRWVRLTRNNSVRNHPQPTSCAYPDPCVAAASKFLENKFFHGGDFGITLPTTYMMDEGDGMKPVTDLRIFRGQNEKASALKWPQSTAQSTKPNTSFASGGLVQLWDPISQVMKRVGRYQAHYFAGKTTEACMFEYGVRPANTTCYSYVTEEHPLLGPIGNKVDKVLFVPKHLLMHHRFTNEYRQSDFLFDFVLRSVEQHGDASVHLRVDMPKGVSSLAMKADQPPGAPPTTALVRKKLEEAPQGCDINHGHAKLLPWHAVDMNELVDGKSRLAHLAALKMEYELVLRLENASETSALKIPQARLKTEELLIKLSPIYKKFLTAFSSHSDAWKAAGIPRPKPVRKEKGNGVRADAESDRPKKRSKVSRKDHAVSEHRVRAAVALFAKSKLFNKWSATDIKGILADIAVFESARTGQTHTLKDGMTENKDLAIKALCIALGLGDNDANEEDDQFEDVFQKASVG